jgi:hypothetical protein
MGREIPRCVLTHNRGAGTEHDLADLSDLARVALLTRVNLQLAERGNTMSVDNSDDEVCCADCESGLEGCRRIGKTAHLE